MKLQMERGMHVVYDSDTLDYDAHDTEVEAFAEVETCYVPIATEADIAFTVAIMEDISPDELTDGEMHFVHGQDTEGQVFYS